MIRFMTNLAAFLYQKMHNFYLRMDIRLQNVQHRKDIAKRRVLTDGVVWTEAQQQTYETYWKQHYGSVPPCELAKFYQATNGVFDPRYISTMFFDNVLLHHMNPNTIATTYAVKTVADSFFRVFAPDVRIPDLWFACREGIYRTTDRICTLEELLATFQNTPDLIIKPARWSARSVGVRCIRIEDGRDVYTGDSLRKIIDAYGPEFICQEKIENSPALAALSPDKLIAFRISTYIVNGKVYSGPATLRIPMHGRMEQIPENSFADELLVGVNDDGTLYDTAYIVGDLETLRLDKLPGTDIAFSGYAIGDIAALRELACRLHSRVPEMGVLSWDLTFDENNAPTFIEMNTLYQGVIWNQIATGKPFFGKETEAVLKTVYGKRKVK